MALPDGVPGCLRDMTEANLASKKGSFSHGLGAFKARLF